MGPKYPAVMMGLVDHDETKVLEETGPLVVPREVLVQSVGVGEEDPRLGPDFWPDPRGGVTIVDRWLKTHAYFRLEFPELHELILGEGLEGVEVEGRSLFVRKEPG